MTPLEAVGLVHEAGFDDPKAVVGRQGGTERAGNVPREGPRSDKVGGVRDVGVDDVGEQRDRPAPHLLIAHPGEVEVGQDLRRIFAHREIAAFDDRITLDPRQPRIWRELVVPPAGAGLDRCHRGLKSIGERRRWEQEQRGGRNDRHAHRPPFLGGISTGFAHWLIRWPMVVAMQPRRVRSGISSG
jgi:hypothetical protein